MTKEECHLWFDYLRGYKPRFKRQRIVGNYILDFYCEQAKLAVEADGSQHYEEEGMLYDAERDLYLLNQGIMVLRFSNRDIWERFEGIKMQIDEEVKKRWHPPTTASRSPAPQGADKDRCFDGSLKSRSVAVNEVEGGIHDGKN
jgi:very-short-patch-repair endonuclease